MEVRPRDVRPEQVRKSDSSYVFTLSVRRRLSAEDWGEVQKAWLTETDHRVESCGAMHDPAQEWIVRNRPNQLRIRPANFGNKPWGINHPSVFNNRLFNRQDIDTLLEPLEHFVFDDFHKLSGTSATLSEILADAFEAEREAPGGSGSSVVCRCFGGRSGRYTREISRERFGEGSTPLRGFDSVVP